MPAEKVVVVSSPANASKVVVVDTPANATTVAGVTSGNARKVMIVDPGELGEKVYFVSGSPGSFLLLADGSSFFLLADGSSRLELASS
jgi:hypothetical protein